MSPDSGEARPEVSRTGQALRSNGPIVRAASDAFTEARRRHHHRRHIQALDRALDVSPYPDVHETYCTGTIWEPEPTEAQVRDAANDLVSMGWPKDIVARLLNISPKAAA